MSGFRRTNSKFVLILVSLNLFAQQGDGTTSKSPLLWHTAHGGELSWPRLTQQGGGTAYWPPLSSSVHAAGYLHRGDLAIRPGRNKYDRIMTPVRGNETSTALHPHL